MQNLLVDLLDNEKWHDAFSIEEKKDLQQCLKTPEHMPWLDYLKSIFSQQPDNVIDDILSDIKTDDIVFFSFLKPFLQKTISEINDRMMQYSGIIDITKIYRVTTKSIFNLIISLSNKVLIYELNKERLQKNLKGDTPESRYNYFIETKLTNYHDILSLLMDYPVLARLICECMQNKIKNFTNAIERLSNDKDEIEENFKLKLNKIIDIKEMGDSHNGGATILKFIDSDNNSIIYKPRCLYIDESFQNLLTWFNENGVLNKFKTMKIISKDNYGWQEYISHELCTEEIEVKRFFQRQGQYFAIFHMLNATDFHYENIIAHGEHPFYIDLESLLHPILDIDMDKKFEFSMDQCEKTLKNSVVRTALLPMLYTSDLYKFDVSGLGARESQQIEVFNIINKNTDVMKMEKQFIKLNTEHHIPSIANTTYYPENNIDELIKGFKNCYFIIVKNKEKLLSDIIVNKFKNRKIRIVLRNTVVYSNFLNASLHPKYLMYYKDRELLFDLLKRDKALQNIADSECKAMLEHDVPYFFCLTDKNNIYSKYGNEKKKLSNSPLQDVINKISMFSDEDYLLQKYFIEKSLLVNKFIIEEKDNLKAISLKSLTNDVNVDTYCKDDFLKEAINIADKLEKSAIKGADGSISWICIGMDGFEHMQFTTLDGTLYSGITGICLFYAYLHHITQEPKYLIMAKSGIKTMLNPKALKDNINISAFNGTGSILYCLTNLFILWKEDWILDEIIKYINLIKQNIEYDSVYDFLGGCAGTLSICSDIYTKLNIKEALDVAILCGNHLIKNYTKMDKGIGWINKHEKLPPLAGLAHGNAGICYSLIKLYSITQNEEYLTTALEGFEYENSLYSKEVNNWRDLRNFSLISINQEPIAWCNGAMGIGLARLATLKYYENTDIKQDFYRALNKTNTDSFIGVNYSLCHGDLGNIELPLMASIRLNDDSLKKQVYFKTASIINDINSSKDKLWKCGIPGRYETESFMIGIAGMAYQLLRIYDNNIPSILILDIFDN